MPGGLHSNACSQTAGVKLIAGRGAWSSQSNRCAHDLTVHCIDVQADSTASKSLPAGTFIQGRAIISSWHEWPGPPATCNAQRAVLTSKNGLMDNATAVITCRLRTAYMCIEPLSEKHMDSIHAVASWDSLEGPNSNDSSLCKRPCTEAPSADGHK